MIRFVLRCVFACSLFGPLFSVASGDVPVTTSVVYSASYSSSGCRGDDPIAVGKCGIAYFNHITVDKLSNCLLGSWSGDANQLSCTYTPTGSTLRTSVTRANVSSCPSFSSSNQSGSCTCDDYHVASNGKCVDPTCTKGEMESAGYYDIGEVATANPVILACSAGCTVQFDGISPAGNALVSGVKHYYAFGQYFKNGDTCAESGVTTSIPTDVQNVPGSTCSDVQTGGELNGQFICVDNDTGNVVPGNNGDVTGSTDSTTTVTENGDGTTTTVTTTTTTDDSGNTSTTTTTTTCDAAGNCTSSSETKGDKTDDQKSECEQNPNSAGCTSLGTAPSAETPFTWSVPMSITPTSGWEHDASCPADHVIQTRLLGSIALPWSLLCTAADYARPVVIAVAWLSAVFSFFGISRRGAE